MVLGGKVELGLHADLLRGVAALHLAHLGGGGEGRGVLQDPLCELVVRANVVSLGVRRRPPLRGEVRVEGGAEGAAGDVDLVWWVGGVVGEMRGWMSGWMDGWMNGSVRDGSGRDQSGGARVDSSGRSGEESVVQWGTVRRLPFTDAILECGEQRGCWCWDRSSLR
jgi:hypothetical protein